MSIAKKGVQYYLIIICSTAVVVVSFADFFGLLSEVPFLSKRIPTLTLLFAGFAMGYLIERGNKLEKIESLLKTAVRGAEIRLFENHADFFTYVNNRIKRAQTIDVTHFSMSAPNVGDPESLEYYEAVTRSIKNKVKVRRLLVIRNQAHLDWARTMMTEFAGSRYFFLRAYAGSGIDIPMINLMIIDKDLVCLGGGQRDPSHEPTSIAVNNGSFAKDMKKHFDTMWDSQMARRIISVDQFEGLINAGKFPIDD